MRIEQGPSLRLAQIHFGEPSYGRRAKVNIDLGRFQTSVEERREKRTRRQLVDLPKEIGERIDELFPIEEDPLLRKVAESMLTYKTQRYLVETHGLTVKAAIRAIRNVYAVVEEKVVRPAGLDITSALARDPSHAQRLASAAHAGRLLTADFYHRHYSNPEEVTIFEHNRSVRAQEANREMLADGYVLVRELGLTPIEYVRFLESPYSKRPGDGRVYGRPDDLPKFRERAKNDNRRRLT